jgi:hypothetical protein
MNNNKKIIISLPLLATILTIAAVASTTTVAYGQEEEEVEGDELQEYVNERYQYAFSYPSGWVFDDFTAAYSQSIVDQVERQLGYGFLGYLCPEDAAIPSLGGSGRSCEAAENLDLVGFVRFTNLDGKIATRLGQATTSTTNVTADDVFAYYVATVLSKDDPENFIDDTMHVQELVSNTPITIDVVDSATGQVISQAEGAIMEFVYGTENVPFGPSFRSYQVFAVYGDTGFTFGVEGLEAEVDSEEVPEVLQTVLDTFRFVV